MRHFQPSRKNHAPRHGAGTGLFGWPGPDAPASIRAFPTGPAAPTMAPIDPPAIPPLLLTRVGEVRARIAAAARRVGRDPAEVTLVAVTKTVSPALARLLPAAGVADAGENRVQEAERKTVPPVPGLRWHLVGHLQTNKARRAVEMFALLHSVDSARLVEALDRCGGQRGVPVDVLLQVNISAEDQKSGVGPEDLPRLLGAAAAAEHVRVHGLMGMGPLTGDPEACRPLFRQLRVLRERANAEGWYPRPLTMLSMGMTNDFEVAVEEGATLVRIGTALFRGVPDPGLPGAETAGA